MWSVKCQPFCVGLNVSESPQMPLVEMISIICRAILHLYSVHVGKGRDVRIIPSFWFGGYVLHVEHISCLIMNWGQHQLIIPFLFSIVLSALLEETLPENIFSFHLCCETLLFQFGFVFRNFAFSECSPYNLCWFLQWQANVMNNLTFVFLLYFFFLKLIVTCRLCVICVREDKDSTVKVMITRLT